MNAGETNGRVVAPRQPSGLGRLLWSIPLGGQLSALYVLLLVVTLAVVGVVVYSQQESFLVQDAAQRLEDTARRVVSLPGTTRPPDDGFPNGGRSNRGGDYGGPGGYNDQSRQISNLIRGLSGPDTTVAILDQQGQVITSTQALEGDETPLVEPVTAQQAADTLAKGRATHWIVTREDGDRYVAVLMPVTFPAFGPGGQNNNITLLLEQLGSLAAADAALNRLGIYLLLGVIGGTIAGVVLGLFFTRAILRPLDRVATTAEAIAGGDLQRRLQLPEGRNEVARLGKTFDYMVSRLVATLEAQRRFVADASHEMRTPLTSLKGMAEILMIGAHGNNTQVIEQSAEAMNSELDRLGRLVNDLLTLSRLDSTGGNATPPPRRMRMDVCAALQAAADQMAALAQGHGVRLTNLCSQPLWVIGDAGQLKQVLLNLLDNAMRYTPAGGEVSLRGSLEGNSAKIEVRDTGSGIDPRDLSHIFERFYRGDASRTRATGNSGLGLAIVKAIVEAHGGQISVESTRGAGTTFTITLPLAPAQATKVEEEVAVAAAR